MGCPPSTSRLAFSAPVRRPVRQPGIRRHRRQVVHGVRSLRLHRSSGGGWCALSLNVEASLDTAPAWSTVTIGDSTGNDTAYFADDTVAGVHTWAWLRTVNTLRVVRDGVLVKESVSAVPGTVAAGTNSFNIGINRGGTLRLNGPLGELIHVARFDQTQFDAITAYLKNKWGTP